MYQERRGKTEVGEKSITNETCGIVDKPKGKMNEWEKKPWARDVASWPIKSREKTATRAVAGLPARRLGRPGQCLQAAFPSSGLN